MSPKQLTDERVRIGAYLAALRRTSGLTQHDLSELTGILCPHIARIESGKKNVGIDSLLKYALVMGYTFHLKKKNGRRASPIR
jgi:transcriptional regulator with XRE-family HTH domain